MIHIVSWYWGDKYPPYFVAKLRRALARNATQPYTFNVVSPKAFLTHPDHNAWAIEDEHLLNETGCIVRVRLFDFDWLARHGVRKGDKVVNLDIDSIVVRNLDSLFNQSEEFTIIQNINSTNPNPYNGSMWMFRAGDYQYVWDEFSIEAWRKVEKHAIHDDQAWLWDRIPFAEKWGPEEGVYGFKKKHWPSGDDLPGNARLVVFPGRRDPRKLGHLTWVDEHWGAVHKMTEEELRSC